jgi:hypothetical protein
MLRQCLKQFGYQNAEDAIEFILAGICIVPPLLMLSGFVFAGAAALMFLIILLAAVGIFTPAPPARPENKKEEK